MLIIKRPQTDPFFNIAAEEYLMKNTSGDCFMLWQNEPSIIIGKHQNALSEINLPFVKENNIPVIRRISGGGTVFHDPGNLNFTFISDGETGKLVDFRKFTQPIIEVLNHLGVPAKFEGKNDLRVNGFKISGNSEHVYKNRILHHGTLLFSSDLTNLGNALRSGHEKFQDRAVQSVRSKVANISDFLTNKISILEFKERIEKYISGKFPGSEFHHLNTSEIAAIRKLSEAKYRTWEWNFGYSPDYFFKNSVKVNEVLYNFEVQVKKGLISEIQFDYKNKSSSLDVFLMQEVVGKRHHYDELLRLFESNRQMLAEVNLKPEILIKILF
ncbi:MAG: lipoate--protein ligase [Bacteroidales bacterium]|nr:lipoate--protein ligase [Bacteroidales bacterium]